MYSVYTSPCLCSKSIKQPTDHLLHSTPENLRFSHHLMATKTSLGAEDIATIDALKAHDLIRSDNYRYLDVRMEEDFKKGHVDVQNTLNISYFLNTHEGRVKNPNFLEQVLQAACNKDAHLVVACGTGGRSVLATTDLQNFGFKNVYNLGGGYKGWKENGLPVIVDEAKAEAGLSVTATESQVENGLAGVAAI